MRNRRDLRQRVAAVEELFTKRCGRGDPDEPHPIDPVVRYDGPNISRIGKGDVAASGAAGREEHRDDKWSDPIPKDVRRWAKADVGRRQAVELERVERERGHRPEDEHRSRIARAFARGRVFYVAKTSGDECAHRGNRDYEQDE